MTERREKHHSIKTVDDFGRTEIVRKTIVYEKAGGLLVSDDDNDVWESVLETCTLADNTPVRQLDANTYETMTKPPRRLHVPNNP